MMLDHVKKQLFVFSAAHWKKLSFPASYRRGMPVTGVRIFTTPLHGASSYYVCPRCSVTLEREFVAFCDRCGQRLDWKDYTNAKKIFVGRPGEALK